MPSKICAFLIKHHEYYNGSVGNWEPIVLRKLAKGAEVGEGSAVRFFNKQFAGNQKDVSGYDIYVATCHSKDQGRLIECLKAMSGEYTAHKVLTLREELIGEFRQLAKQYVTDGE